MPRLRLPGSVVVLTALLVLIPIAAWLEYKAPDLWSSRLALPHVIPRLARHTPQHFQGTFLPPVIKTSRTLCAADSPVLLTSATEVAPGATLTIEAGTAVYAHEFARLVVKGTLRIAGERGRPVTFTTNEVHPANQWWGGLVAAPGGRLTIRHALIEYAYPGLTCRTNSQAVLSDSTIRYTSMGIFTTTPSCAVENSLIRAPRPISVYPSP